MVSGSEATWLSVTRQALVGSAYHAPLLRILGEWRGTGVILAIVAVVAFAFWARRPRLASWTLLSFTLAALLLCGFPYAGWCVALIATLPLFTITRRELRPRTGALLFLAAAPTVYAAMCWLLLSHLILDDALYAWRFVPRLDFIASRIPAWTIVAACVLVLSAAVFAALRRHALCAASFAVALYMAWACALSGLGLGWSIAPCGRGLPASSFQLPEAKSQTPSPNIYYPLSTIYYLLSARPEAALAPPPAEPIASYVRSRTPWGRVFVCGYAGLRMARCGDEADAAIFEPCLDLRIDVLRAAYEGQRLYLLIPRPDGPNALEPPVWRYGDIYHYGAPRLLYAADFGAWRLFEVVASAGP